MFKIKKISEAYARVIGPVDLLDQLSETLTIPVANFWFHPKYKMGLWDGRIRFFNKGKILTGLLPKVTQYLDDRGYEYEIDPGLGEKTEVDFKRFIRVTKNSFKGNFIPNIHQMRGAFLAIKNRKGILSHCTSAGKTFTCWAIINYLMTAGHIENALLVVPKIGLVEQTVKEFLDYGTDPEDIGRFYGEVKEPGKKITISTWQSLKDKKKITNEILGNADMFICDEIHSAKANVVRTVFERCTAARWRIGVTGTIPEERADIYTIRGLTGNILDKVKTKELQDKGIVSKMKLNILFLKHSKEFEKSVLDYQHERVLLENSTRRNRVIATLAKGYLKKKKNVLILYDKLDHGKKIKDRMSGSKYKKMFQIEGDVKVQAREEAREYAEENDGVLLLATYGVFSTGVNIKNLHVVIFASTGKAKIKLLQSVGRGLRKHPNKKHLMLFDVADSTKYSKRHLEKRLEYYTNEEYDLEMNELIIGD